MGFTFLLSIVFLSVTHASISGSEEKTGNVRESVTIQCRFDTYFRNYQKCWCKGYYKRSCTVLVQTNGPEKKSHDGRIRITADNAKGQLTVHMDQITKSDKGWYWCGIDRPNLLDPLTPIRLKVLEGEKIILNDKERQSACLPNQLIPHGLRTTFKPAEFGPEQDKQSCQLQLFTLALAKV
ncbi:CMRF35-like molecule 5 [Chiloscyllium punctatum]|uniref:CMRF35-like molecule 5 n=1 Tax=Chiloscyllium punctatum TaxID=137246 RepID=UPI003B637C10